MLVAGSCVQECVIADALTEILRYEVFWTYHRQYGQNQPSEVKSLCSDRPAARVEG